MRNKILIVLLCVVLLFSITGCGKEELKGDSIGYEKKEIEEGNDVLDLFPGKDIVPGDEKYYYTFTGKSDNISFKTGIADYRDDKAEFKLEDIEVNPNLDYDSAGISVYFNGKHFGTTNFFKDDLKNNKLEVGLSSIGKKIRRDADGKFYGEFDSFMETDPDDFANALKVEFSYNKKENSKKEELKLDIEKHLN